MTIQTAIEARDYSLTGPSAQQAADRGLVGADWYQSHLPRKVLKDLMRRSDGPALRDTAIWMGALVFFGGLGVWAWGTVWAVPAFAVYGVLYGSASDSRWHECGHGTAFKTRWMNDVVYHVSSFMLFREPTLWRWSHARHHTDTLIVGRDPEIAIPRPPNLLAMALNVLALKSAPLSILKILRHAFGRVSADERDFIPESEIPRLVAIARVYIAIHVANIVAAIALGSWIPIVLFTLPRFYGAWLQQIWAHSQHAGLAEDVLDHRLNSRTIHMNPVLRFLYWNMNYHIEHHMFPMVPYHALPRLHEALRDDMPAPYPSLLEAYREIVPALLRQRHDPTYHVVRRLPATAKPLKVGPHGAVA